MELFTPPITFISFASDSNKKYTKNYMLSAQGCRKGGEGGKLLQGLITPNALMCGDLIELPGNIVKKCFLDPGNFYSLCLQGGSSSSFV